MKKVLIFILVCPLLVCCHNQRRHNMVPVIQTDTMDVFRHIFKSRTLQDSIDVFTKRIDSIPNYYNAPLLYMIFMEKEDNDTIIRFIASWSLIREIFLNDEQCSSLHIEGACRINDKTFVIYNRNIADISKFINKELLVLTEDEYDFFKNYDGPLCCDRSWYPLSSRTYRLFKTDSLVLLGFSKK